MSTERRIRIPPIESSPMLKAADSPARRQAQAGESQRTEAGETATASVRTVSRGDSRGTARGRWTEWPSARMAETAAVDAELRRLELSGLRRHVNLDAARLRALLQRQHQFEH